MKNCDPQGDETGLEHPIARAYKIDREETKKITTPAGAREISQGPGLRIDARTGDPLAEIPFASSSAASKRLMDDKIYRHLENLCPPLGPFLDKTKRTKHSTRTALGWCKVRCAHFN